MAVLLLNKTARVMYIFFVSALLFGCMNISNDQNIATTDIEQSRDNFVATSEVTLKADGENHGDTAYELIQEAFGKRAIEAPDLYRKDHRDVIHIHENTDDIVGHHFVFLAHRDLDKNKGVTADRQRNEIKAYDKSSEELKGYLGDTLQYRWKFKVTKNMELSRNFSHFFQLKAKNKSQDNANGNDDHPVITISGGQYKSGSNRFIISHSRGVQPGGSKAKVNYLYKGDWDVIAGEWLDVFVQASYAEQGEIKIYITRLRDKQVIVDIHKSNIDLWRGNATTDFVRPKWGIYRSLKDKNSLRAEEEKVYFSDFSIKKQ